MRGKQRCARELNTCHAKRDSGYTLGSGQRALLCGSTSNRTTSGPGKGRNTAARSSLASKYRGPTPGGAGGERRTSLLLPLSRSVANCGAVPRDAVEFSPAPDGSVSPAAKASARPDAGCACRMLHHGKAKSALATDTEEPPATEATCRRSDIRTQAGQPLAKRGSDGHAERCVVGPTDPVARRRGTGS